MRLPGENTLTLNHEAIGALVQDALNAGRKPSECVRITNVKRPNSYSDELNFTLTTELPELGPPIFHADPAPQPELVPVPPPAVDPLPTPPDDRFF